MRAFRLLWTTHKWVGITVSALVLNSAATGFLLLIKKHAAWIQPAERLGASSDELAISFDRVLQALRGVPEAMVSSWADVDRLDVRPGRGMLKARTDNGWEVQVDLATGEVLQVAWRRSDLIESIHDGSFYHQRVHDWLMPAFAIALVVLAGSGLFLWIEPKLRRSRWRSRRLAHGNP